MTRFLAANWLWILLIGGMVVMHFGHGRAGHMGGCGGYSNHAGKEEHSSSNAQRTTDAPDGLSQMSHEEPVAQHSVRQHRGC